jgi:hypothetical protein
MYVSKVARSSSRPDCSSVRAIPNDPRAFGLALTERGTRSFCGRFRSSRAAGRVDRADRRAEGARAKELADVLPCAAGIGVKVPTLTGQTIAEAQGAVRALLDRTLAGSGLTSNEYVALRVATARRVDDLAGFLAGHRS